MPWFPIPFVLTGNGELQTKDYKYTEVRWYSISGEDRPLSMISSSTGSATSFSYYDPNFQEFGTSTNPGNLTPPSITLDNMDCSKIEYVIKPINMADAGRPFNITYKLKIRLKPNVKNRTVKIRFHARQYCVDNVYYFLNNGVDNTGNGATNTWGTIRDNLDPSLYLGCNPFLWAESGYGTKITTTQEVFSANYGQPILIRNWQGSFGFNEYVVLLERTSYREIEIDFLTKDSYAYLIFGAEFDTQSSSWLEYYSRRYPNTTHTSTSCLTMELENKNDIIFGEGLSNIYVGENLVDAGILNMGENSPSAIYVGENMVWSK